MNKTTSNTNNVIWVAIDVAKAKNDVLIELPDGKRKKFKMANSLTDFKELVRYLKAFNLPCEAGLEATGNYHRPLAYHLQMAGFTVHLISSLASARTREALHNSWDKNDPKDAQVILHLLKTGVVQTYHDPLIHKFNDVQEIAKTYHQISLRKVRVQHCIMNHYLPLYFPEVEKYFHSSRAQWFTNVLLKFPVPSAITKYTAEEFSTTAWEISGRKVNKQGWLADFYHTAAESIGLPVAETDQAVAMFNPHISSIYKI